MDKLFSIFVKYINKKSRAWRSLVTCLSAIVVFTTTYALILPAITLDTDTAYEEPGIQVDEGEIFMVDEAADENTALPASGEDEGSFIVEDTDDFDNGSFDLTDGTEYEDGAAENNLFEDDEDTALIEEDEFYDDSDSVMISEDADNTGLYMILREGSDGNYYAMSSEGRAVYVEYDAAENIAYYSGDAEVLWTRDGNSFSNNGVFLDVTAAAVGGRAISDELCEVTVNPVEDGRTSLYTTENTGSEEEPVYSYNCLVLSEDEGSFTVIRIDTPPVNRVILARTSDAHEETASEDALFVDEVYEESAAEETESVAEEAADAEDAEDEEPDTMSETVSVVEEMAEIPTDSDACSSVESAVEEIADPFAPVSGELTYEGDDYTITVNYDETAGIPEDAELKVSEILPGTAEYDSYYEKAAGAVLENGKAKPIGYARFFDISFIVQENGWFGTTSEREIEPETGVSVIINYRTAASEDAEASDEIPDEDAAVTVPENTQEMAPQLSEDAAELSVVHFTKDDAQIIDSVDAVQIAEDEAAVSFQTDSFSVYGLVYTVDFEYSVNGKMYQFSLPGGEKITLSDLVEVLGIIGSTNNGEKAAFNSIDAFLKEVANVEFSDERLVEVTPVEGGWELESLEPFTTEESLTITMKNGDVVTVKVTDAQDDGVWDLTDTSNTQYLHVSADSTVTQNEQERDAAFKLTFTYSLTEDVVHAIDAYNGTPILKYDLNSLIADTPIGDIRNNLNGVISIGSRKLGTYTIVDGVVTLKFTDTSYFDGRSTFTGFFTVTVQTNETELGTNDEYTYSFPGTTDVIPIHYKKTVEEGKKSVNSTKNDDGSYTLHYSADINVNSDLDSMTFNDTLGGLQSLDASSVKINGTAVAVSQSGQSFSFDVASALGTTGVAKGSYKVTYDTKVTEEQLKAMSEDKTTETNTASWKVNGNKDVPGGDTTIEIDKPREPIPVTKTVDKTDAQPGDTVTYTITYGKDTTGLSGFHISDYITDVVIPQGDVTLTYNGQTTHVNFDSQSKDSSYSKGTVTLFDYTFPEGTAGNGPVIATYTVKLIDSDTAKANGIYDATEVSNTAQEHRQNTTATEKTTVTYEKEPHYDVIKVVSADPNRAKWEPDTVLSYTLTVGDSETNMAGVNIKDVISDQQILQGDIMITVGNGSPMKLSDYVAGSIKWSDDGQYSDTRVTLFDFNMPSNAGNGPVVITYQTKVISQVQATASDIFGEHRIENTGSAGGDHDSTSHTAVFDPYPINKQVTKENADVNHQTVKMGDTVHYTLTYGEAGMNLAGAVIEDQMTDLQKLVSAITVTKADGTSFTMPTGTGQWSEDGNNWDFWDDGKYSTGKICLFKYKLPADIGQGPITIEYDTQIISEAEANESGIHGDQSAFNDFKDNHDTVETEVKIEFPKQVTHNPQVRKEFDHWDVENSKVYWNIIVEKDADSAYPLENVTVQEAWDQSHVSITEGNQGFYGYNQFNGTYFDITNAVVTTDDGTVLTPGVDYTIDKSTTKFTFPVLNERVHINLAFLSPAKIIDGYYMSNEVRLNNGKTGNADQTYNKPEVEAVKNGKYNEDSRIVTWEVQINPKAKQFDISDANKYVLLFEDYIPEGLTILNYDNNSESNPSVHVAFGWRNYNAPITAEVQGDGATKITGNIHPKYVTWDGQQHNSDVSLSGEKVVVTYKTKLSDEEWDRITSSASGSETFQNNVTITAGDNEKFDATDKVTVTSDGYITKTDTTKDVGGVVFDEATDQNSKNITYSIEINPHGYALNNGNTLSLTDYIDTNMDLDTASVAISSATLGADGKLHAGDTVPVGIEVSYNDDSRLLSIREIPDRTPLLLTYTCIARAQGQDTFKNTATLIGGGSHSASTHETHTIQTNDAGVAIDGIEMFIHKIDENNISKDLNGAQFQLYECELEIGSMTNSETYPQSYWDDLLAKMDRITAGNGTAAEIEEIKEQFKITRYTPVGDPVTTSGSGSTQWIGLNEHKLYAWKEVGAPEGYTGSEEYHYFVAYQYLDVNTEDPSQTKSLSEEEQTNRKHAAWALDDATQLANDIRVASMANLTTWTATNVESKYTSISATKVWENDSDNLFETRPEGGIKLQLVRINADGTTDNIGEKVSINVDDEGNWPTYIWNKLPAQDNEGNALRYTVVEDKVENYSTTYSDGGEGKTSGEITVTNRMIPKSTDIHVKKVFDVDEGDEMPSEIKVSLMVIKTDRDGVVGEPEETSYETRLSDSNDWSWTFASLPTTDTDGNTLAYTAVEDTTALAAQGFCYIVSYSDDGSGVIETTADDPLVITNSNETGKITVKKTFAGVDDETDLAALQDGLTVTVAGKDVGGKGIDTLTLTWDDVKGEGKEITGLPLNETYTVTESISADSILQKYVVTSDTVSTATATSTLSGETAELENIYEEAPQTGSLKITKNVKVDNEDTTGTLADGTYTFVIKDNNGNTASGKVNGAAIADGKVTITISNGATSSVEVTDLKEGTYKITEETPTNGTMLTVVKSGAVEKQITSSSIEADKTATVTVVAGQTGDNVALAGTAEFTNSNETTSIKVKKEWGDTKDHSSETIPFSIIQILPISADEHTASVYSTGHTVEGDGTVTEISGLPKYGSHNGTRIQYQYDIIEGKPEAAIQEAYTASRGTTLADGTLVMVNTPVSDKDTYTDLTVEKIWKDGENTVSNTADSITFRLERYEISTDYVPVQFTNNAYNLSGSEAASGIWYVPKNSTFELKFKSYLVVGFGTVYYSVNGTDGSIPSNGNVTLTITEPTKIDVGGWGTVSKAQPASGTVSYDSAAALVTAMKNGNATKNSEFDYTYTYSGDTLTAADGAPTATTETSSWVANLNNLDEYIASSGKIYTYKITEVKINDDPVVLNQTDDYAVTVTETSTETGTKTTITNSKKEHTQLEVEKKWLSADGSEMVTKPNNIVSFRLTQHIIDGSNSELASRPYVTDSNNGIYELKSDNSWKQTFDALPKTGTYTYTPEGEENAITVAVTYKYSVEETSVKKIGPGTDVLSEYNVSYQFTVKNESDPAEASSTYLIGEDGKLTINNTTIYSVALPSTGGPGTRLFSILGSILILGAGVLLWRRRRTI